MLASPAGAAELAARAALAPLEHAAASRRDDARCARAPALLRFSPAQRRARGSRPAPLQAAA